MGEFSEKFQKGGGDLNPKIYIADFGPLNRAFWAWNWLTICNMIFRKWGGVKVHLELLFFRVGVAICPSLKADKEPKDNEVVTFIKQFLFP